MTVVKIKPQPHMTEQFPSADNSSLDNSSHIPFLNKSTLYQKTRKFHAHHFQSIFQIDALTKNFHLYFDEKKHKKFSFISQLTFSTFLASNFLLFLDALSITNALQSYSSFFMILSFFSLMILCLILPSLISTEQLKIDNNKVPLIWILYHNLQFKSEAQKESWLLHHISNNNYYHLFFFSAHSFSADIQKHIAEAQQNLDNLAT